MSTMTEVKSKTQPQSDIAENKSTSIPFNQLRRSDENMRTVHPEESPADKQLISSIRANGILQNLVVFPTGKDTFEIPAGGRRFGALEYLVKYGEIPSDFLVNCVVVDSNNATDVSLVENYQRLAPHPADTFLAFEKLISNGATVKDVARSYGITEAKVNQFLRLAGLHPELMELFKSDKFNLDQAMAYASTADQALQIATFKVFGESTNTNGDRIRNALNENRCSSDTALAQFVTVDAYKEAGGSLEVDLFTDVANLFDLSLLIELAEKKLQDAADELTGWKWVETSIEGVHGLYRFGRIPHQQSEVPMDIVSKLQAYKDRIDVLEEFDWEEGTDENEKLCKEYDELEEKVQRLEDDIDTNYRVYDPEDMKYAGCIVAFDQSSGELITYTGLMNQEDELAYKKRGEDHSESDHSDDGKHPVATTTSTKAEKPNLSGALISDLGKYRRAIIRSALVENPETARNFFEFQLCTQVCLLYTSPSPRD